MSIEKKPLPTKSEDTPAAPASPAAGKPSTDVKASDAVTPSFATPIFEPIGGGPY